MDRLSTDNLIVARRTLIFVVSDQTPRTYARFNLLTNSDVDRDFAVLCRMSVRYMPISTSAASGLAPSFDDTEHQ